MTALDQLRRLWAHAAWADAELLDALRRTERTPDAALREFAHVIGAEEVWLSRLEGREARCAVWPALGLDEVATLAQATHAGYVQYLAALTGPELARGVAYTNSAGRHFTTAVADILLHVALHGQYHRGKVNLLLREHGAAPAPVDFIAFARGVPAATTSPQAHIGAG